MTLWEEESEYDQKVEAIRLQVQAEEEERAGRNGLAWNGVLSPDGELIHCIPYHHQALLGELGFDSLRQMQEAGWLHLSRGEFLAGAWADDPVPVTQRQFDAMYDFYKKRGGGLLSCMQHFVVEG